MTALIHLAARSLWNRRFTAGLAALSITISVALLIGVEKVRTEARSSFTQTVAGTDLIVGARSGSIQLLLYSVFRIGDATANVSWDSYQRISSHPMVAWAIPLSLGDSHRGYRVVGTTDSYFERLRYGGSRSLEMAEGAWFDDLFEAVLGAEVARSLGYRIGDEITLAHGTGSHSFVDHDDMPFTISGILAPTGTPVDQSIHVSLEAIEAIHLGWQSGVPIPGQDISPDAARSEDLTPRSITAFLLGLQSRAAVFQIQRAINAYPDEALSAILPGVALQQLWNLVGIAENALLVVAAFVVFAGLAGMVTMLLASLSERRREMAILRSVGARPVHVFGLLTAESTLLGAIGALAGFALVYGAMALGAPLAQASFGIHLAPSAPSTRELVLLGMVIAGAACAGAIPAWRAYRLSLADGLSIRT